MAAAAGQGTMPATMRPIPSTADPGRPSANRIAITDSATSATPSTGRRPLAQTHRAEVEEDPGAARQREEREDEADERSVDAERCGNPATNAGDDAILLAPLERQRRDQAHRRSFDVDLGRRRPSRR